MGTGTEKVSIPATQASTSCHAQFSEPSTSAGLTEIGEKKKKKIKKLPLPAVAARTADTARRPLTKRAAAKYRPLLAHRSPRA
ncbi:hypothetical protein NDU88_002128 [Pleurodeles waltl]|uniref:Uncharacterized protein n=1 Tax=Pleurodeles waltl TaxID=8319 RepID=A0AAV7NFH8_PLEWA|nr:hypothetical protein NDU88_002128 [Pleurodeles waltl]